MKLSKKILAIVMSFVMLVACFAVSASAAYVYEPEVIGGELKLSVVADKTTVNPGDVVNFEMRVDSGTITNLSSFMAMFIYNGDQLTPVGATPATFRTWQGNFAACASPNAGGNMNMPVATQIGSKLTAEEKEYYTKGIMIAGQMSQASLRWTPASGGEAIMSFQMTVNQTVTPGEEIWFGLHDASYQLKKSTFAVNGIVQQNMSTFDLSDGMVKLTVAEKSSIFNSRQQMRIKTDAQKVTTETFDYRFVSSISAADWAAKFANTAKEGATTNCITEAGFAFVRGTGNYTMDEVKAGTVQTTQKIRPASGENGTYDFGCVVYNIPKTVATDPNGGELSMVSYVKYLDANGNPQIEYYTSVVKSTIHPGYIDICNQQGFTY